MVVGKTMCPATSQTARSPVYVSLVVVTPPTGNSGISTAKVSSKSMPNQNSGME